MEIWLYGLLLGTLVAVGCAFVWIGWRLRTMQNPGTNTALLDGVNKDVEHIFDDKFRQELRNRGKLHFEKIIGENAMFLQQDLRLTASQLNEHMKQEIDKTLTEEFAKYEQSIADAKQLALKSINKTQEAIEQQRQILGDELKQQLDQEKARMVARFEEHMADIVNHYVLEAIGNEIDLTDQLEYILQELERNKQAIIEDVNHGA
ncbi:hypothetical protein KA047_01330 [Candidatus Saccharibacteria bacterium]|nr:hypothetical protein [Candidatus Saccharibacteria bacterium]